MHSAALYLKRSRFRGIHFSLFFIFLDWVVCYLFDVPLLIQLPETRTRRNLFHIFIDVAFKGPVRRLCLQLESMFAFDRTKDCVAFTYIVSAMCKDSDMRTKMRRI